tara:strand:+ start:1055 stop:1222 length:168 start_codon:yes stop_codon:yes gene_type:complete
MPVYPSSRNIQVKSRPINTKVNQAFVRPPPRDSKPIVSTMPYMPAKQSMKRYKKK